MPDLGSVHYGDLIRQNLAYYVSQLLGSGRSEADVLAQLLKRHRDVDPLVLWNAYGQGTAAHQAGAGFPKLGSDRFVGPTSTPVNPDIPTPWRYVLQIEAIDPAGGESQFRMMVIDASQRLRKNELQAEMLNRWNQVLAGLGYPSISFAQANFARIAQVQSIERQQ